MESDEDYGVEQTTFGASKTGAAADLNEKEPKSKRKRGAKKVAKETITAGPD